MFSSEAMRPQRWPLRRILLALVLFAVNFLILRYSVAIISHYFIAFEQSRRTLPDFASASLPPEAPFLPTALFAVIVVFLVDVAILWALSKIGGPLQADVTASIKKFGGSIWITGAGLIGAFLLIAFLGVITLLLLSRRTELPISN
jgi:hypothetical protein